jgi:hypothetical protein
MSIIEPQYCPAYFSTYLQTSQIWLNCFLSAVPCPNNEKFVHGFRGMGFYSFGKEAPIRSRNECQKAGGTVFAPDQPNKLETMFKVFGYDLVSSRTAAINLLK